jgi:EAL and modified HD-GYP domain-containing signal transduction protein
MTSASPIVETKRPTANLARQPIFDSKLKTVGYELLFRGDPSQTPSPEGSTRITSLVLADTLAEFGLETVVGTLPAWVSFPSEYLTEKLPIPIGPKALVIQVHADVTTNDEALERLHDLKQQSYRIVFDATGHDPNFPDILRIASTTKIDIQGRTVDEVKHDVAFYSKHPTSLLANRVSRMSDFDACHKLGFTLFQGNFICQPEQIKQKRVPTNRIAMVRLMTELYSDNPSTERIRNLVQQDVTLSYRLLKWLNSSLFALPHPVESIQHALLMLGMNRLRNLVSLIVLSRVDDKPAEVVTNCLMRARIGEKIARHYDVSAETMFTVGLLSLLDVLIGTPMEQILETMPLASELQQAILRREGMCGRLLSGIEAHERGDWAGVETAGLDLSILTPAWVDAAVWVRQIRAMTATNQLRTTK